MDTINTVNVNVALERAKICEGLDAAQVGILAKVFTGVKVVAGEQFIKQDAQSKEVYIIASGIVEVEIPVVGKTKDSSLARLQAGDSVGEFALLRDARRSATARAVNEVTLVMATAMEILALFDLHPTLGYGVCRNLGRILADRLTDTNMQLRSLLSRG